MKNLIITFLFLLLGLTSFSTKAQQEDPNNPRTWQHFAVYAHAEDDSVFIIIQEEMGIEPKLESFKIVVNISDPSTENQYVLIGDNEVDPNAFKFQWNQLSKYVKDRLINWSIHKENLNPRRITYGDPLFYNIKQIKIKEFIAPVNKERQANGSLNYINPYFQFFGGEPVGIPIRRSVGFSFGIGTKYSGPFESDQIKAGIHLFGASISYITRLQGLNTHALGKEDKDNGLWKQYNNIFSPVNAWEISYVIPFGNFLEISMTSDFGDSSTNGPRYAFFENGDNTKPMPNNIIRGKYFNVELRYPFRIFGATRTQLYAAYYAKEVNIGLFTRESRLAGCVFDMRTNFTITKMRNFQILFEFMASQLGEGFSMNSFAIGPSFRFSRIDNGRFGVHTVFINMRFKLGDFFEEHESK